MATDHGSMGLMVSTTVKVDAPTTSTSRGGGDVDRCAIGVQGRHHWAAEIQGVGHRPRRAVDDRRLCALPAGEEHGLGLHGGERTGRESARLTTVLVAGSMKAATGDVSFRNGKTTTRSAAVRLPQWMPSSMVASRVSVAGS